MTLTSHICLVLRSRMSTSTPPLSLHARHMDDFATPYNNAEHHITGYAKHITEK